MAAHVLNSRARAPNQFLSIRSRSTITSTRIAMVCPCDVVGQAHRLPV
jgi:hypothetical protein